MEATYTKLRDGSWGLRVTGGAPEPGAAVTVRKQSGETKTETVGRILFSGNGVVLATIAGGNKTATTATPRAGKPGGRVCADCGRSGRLVRDLEDGLMKHYNCCDIPPGGY
jgi:hypothetical protein